MSGYCVIMSEALRVDPTVAATAQNSICKQLRQRYFKCSILYFSDQVTYEWIIYSKL
jgi:hypothetical protein